jgi:hypothetical protein
VGQGAVHQGFIDNTAVHSVIALKSVAKSNSSPCLSTRAENNQGQRLKADRLGEYRLEEKTTNLWPCHYLVPPVVAG